MPNQKDKSDIGTNARDIDIVIETEHGNKIAFVDESFECGKKDDGLDDYAWSQCGAMSLAGDPEDEVLVIESGNRRKIDSNYGPQSSPGTVTEVAGDSNSRGGGWSPTARSNWKDAKDRSLWGTDLSPYQNEGCKYKEHVVRRELVHGSYEEHIEGDMYTTIEGTWISKIKGNIWDTFYGYCHEDFNEHFEEVFYSTKTEVQVGNIVEYNYGESEEYYYEKVVNEYNADVTTRYKAKDGKDYGSTVQNWYGEPGTHISTIDHFYGPKLQFCWGEELNISAANKNDMFLGGLKTDMALGSLEFNLSAGMLFNTYLLFCMDIYAAFRFERCPMHVSADDFVMETNRVRMKQGAFDLSF